MIAAANLGQWIEIRQQLIVSETLWDLQETALLSLGAAGKVPEVDDWAEAQVGQREQTARPLLEACLDKCRLVRPS